MSAPLNSGRLRANRGAAPSLRRPLREKFVERFLHRRAGGKKILQCDAKGAAKAQQLVVGDTANLGFDLRQRAPADVPTLETNTRCQLVLSQTELIPKLPDFRTDDVLPSFLAHTRRSCRFLRSELLRYRSSLRLRNGMPVGEIRMMTSANISNHFRCGRSQQRQYQSRRNAAP